jgi:hypothetical protein
MDHFVQRPGELDRRLAASSVEAVKVGILILAARTGLWHGDSLRVILADDGLEETVRGFL